MLQDGAAHGVDHLLDLDGGRKVPVGLRLCEQRGDGLDFEGIGQLLLEVLEVHEH